MKELTINFETNPQECENAFKKSLREEYKLYKIILQVGLICMISSIFFIRKMSLNGFILCFFIMIIVLCFVQLHYSNVAREFKLMSKQKGYLTHPAKHTLKLKDNKMIFTYELKTSNQNFNSPKSTEVQLLDVRSIIELEETYVILLKSLERIIIPKTRGKEDIESKKFMEVFCKTVGGFHLKLLFILRIITLCAIPIWLFIFFNLSIMNKGLMVLFAILFFHLTYQQFYLSRKVFPVIIQSIIWSILLGLSFGFFLNAFSLYSY